MGQFEVHASVEVDAPIELVFERITDHEAMSDWPGIQSCKLVKDGTPRNGLGAVREVKAMGWRLTEEIVQFDPPHRYDYSIIAGLPVKHRGTITLSSLGPTRVRVAWDVRVASRVPLLSGLVGRLLARGLPGALEHFAVDTERRARPSRA